MRCIVSGDNAKLIARSMQSLSKFGCELFVDVNQTWFMLRSIIDSKSAIGTFKFHKSFFDDFVVSPKNDNFCKLSMKACLEVFKNMKQVEHCIIKLLPKECKLQVQLRYRLETVKDALINFVDEENVMANVSIKDDANLITGTHKVFSEIFNNFNNGEHEITLIANNDYVIIKNCIDEESNTSYGEMHSQLRLLPTEFETYKISKETIITFCIKEFRGFVAFAEHINQSIHLHFEETGRPLIVNIGKVDQVECELVLSTLLPDDSYYVNAAQDAANASVNVSITNKRKNSSKCDRNKAMKLRKTNGEEILQNNNSNLFHFGSNITNIDICGITRREDVQPESGENSMDNNMEMEEPESEQEMDTGTALESEPEPDPICSFIPHSRSRSNIHHPKNISVTFFDTEESEKDVQVIPQSPQRGGSSLRTIFSRCFESTFIPKEPTPNSDIYVPNSDTED